jgi:hypothetical protein
MVSVTGGVGRFAPMVIVVEGGDATGASYSKGSPKEPLHLKDKSVLLSEKCLIIMCCGYASGSLKLKFVVTGKAKKTIFVLKNKVQSCPLLQPERSTDG